MLTLDEFSIDSHGWEVEFPAAHSIPKINSGDWAKIVIRHVNAWEIGVATSYTESSYWIKALQINTDSIEGKIVSAPATNTVPEHVAKALFTGQEVKIHQSFVHQKK